jgi:hypothetical protein
MSRLTIRLPDDKHQRLRELALAALKKLEAELVATRKRMKKQGELNSSILWQIPDR